jgi:hypothetical protein
MELITGPRTTPPERTALADAADGMGLIPVTESTPWAVADTVYVLPGWERCPDALADVQTAHALAVTVVHLTSSAVLRSAS